VPRQILVRRGMYLMTPYCYEFIHVIKLMTLRNKVSSLIAVEGPIRRTREGGVSVFYTGKPTKGVPEVVDCAVRIVIGRPRTRRYAQGHGTQDLYRFGMPRWRTLRPVWAIMKRTEFPRTETRLSAPP
jgi:hypothetical protein